MTNRRTFLKKAGDSVAIATITPAATLIGAPQTAGKAVEDSFKLGIAGYSFLHFKLDQALEMMKKVDVHYLCIKDGCVCHFVQNPSLGQYYANNRLIIN